MSDSPHERGLDASSFVLTLRHAPGIFSTMKPLGKTAARSAMRRILDVGAVTYGTHSKEEMAKDRIEAVDAENVIRAGVVSAAEFENGRWRYQVRSAKICVVVQFVPDDLDHDPKRMFVVTAWRLQ